MTLLAWLFVQKQLSRIDEYSYLDRARWVKIGNEFLYRRRASVSMPPKHAARHVDQRHPHQRRIWFDPFGVTKYVHEMVCTQYPVSQQHSQNLTAREPRHPYSPHTPKHSLDPEWPNVLQIIRRGYSLWRTMESLANLNTLAPLDLGFGHQKRWPVLLDCGSGTWFDRESGHSASPYPDYLSPPPE